MGGKAEIFRSEVTPAEAPPAPKPAVSSGKSVSPAAKPPPVEIEDGRRAMHKIFVEAKLISSGDFDLCWSTPDLSAAPNRVIEPFIQILGDKGILSVDKSLRVLTDKTRIAFLPLK